MKPFTPHLLDGLFDVLFEQRNTNRSKQKWFRLTEKEHRTILRTIISSSLLLLLLLTFTRIQHTVRYNKVSSSNADPRTCTHTHTHGLTSNPLMLKWKFIGMVYSSAHIFLTRYFVVLLERIFHADAIAAAVAANTAAAADAVVIVLFCLCYSRRWYYCFQLDFHQK